MVDEPQRTKKSLLLIANCDEGVMNAGRFIMDHLFDENAIIYLIQSYDFPSGKQDSVSESITPVLDLVANRELSDLRKKMIEKFGIPAGQIEIRSHNGQLEELIDSFGPSESVSVTVGFDKKSKSNRASRQDMITDLLSCSTRPVFLVRNSITVIEDLRILVISDDSRNYALPYHNFLIECSRKYDYDLEFITKDNRRKVKMNSETLRHFSVRAIQKARKETSLASFIELMQ